MSKNITAIALNSILFDELNQLRTATGEQLKDELKRAESINGIATTIIENNKTILNAAELQAKFYGEKGIDEDTVNQVIGIDYGKN